MKSLMRQINIISRCAGTYRADKLGDTDIKPVHHSFILAICRHPGISQDELSRHIYINKSNVTRNLSYLEERGYAERRQSENDKRVILVYPTQKMLDIYPQVRSATDECNEYLTEDFSDEEIDVFRNMLERISERARKYVDSRGDK